jgi:hypothetical protein
MPGEAGGPLYVHIASGEARSEQALLPALDLLACDQAISTFSDYGMAGVGVEPYIPGTMIASVTRGLRELVSPRTAAPLGFSGMDFDAESATP